MEFINFLKFPKLELNPSVNEKIIWIYDFELYKRKNALFLIIESYNIISGLACTKNSNHYSITH